MRINSDKKIFTVPGRDQPGDRMSVANNVQARHAVLAKIKLFEGLDAQQLRPLLVAGQIKQLNESTPLLWQGETATHLVAVLSGNTRIFRLCEDGREAVTRILGPGDTMFENVIFYDAPSPVCGEVINQAELLFIPAALVRAQAKRSAAFACQLVQVLAERTNQMMYQIEQLTLHSVVNRLCNYFLGELFRQQARDTGYQLEFEKSLLAKHLGMTPETLSRSLRELASHGVQVHGKLVVITDPCSLCKSSDPIIRRKCANYSATCRP